MILEGYDAIVVNAASPDGAERRGQGSLRRRASSWCRFDGIVTEPCAWRIAVDFKEMGRGQVEYLAGRLPEGGNLLEIRGLAGVFVDDEISAGIHEGVEQFPQFKIVGSVHGDWAQDVAQKAVAGILPRLPEIVGVVTQGGDGYGAAQAFAAAGRADADHHHGQPPGRAGVVEGAEGRQRLRDDVGLDRARRLDAGLLGRPADPRRQGSAEGSGRAVPAHRPGQSGGQTSPPRRPGGVANVEYTLEDAIAVIEGAK